VNGHDPDPQPRYDVTNENRCAVQICILLLVYAACCIVAMSQFQHSVIWYNGV